VTSEYNVPSEPYFMTVTKMDAQGNEKWTSRFSSFDGLINGTHSCLLELDNGGYLVNYIRDTFGGNDIPPIFIWLDSMGNVTQQYDFPNERILTINDLIKTADGRIVGVGQVDLLDYDMGYAGWIFAFTQSGEPLWERYIVDQRFLPEKLSWLSSVEELEDGRLAAIGTIDTPLDVDAWLIVTDSEGCLEPGCMGELQGYFSDSKSIEETSLKVSIFPNPVSGDDLYLTNFKTNNFATIYIHDSLGRLVLKQVASQKVGITMLMRGIYFLSLQYGDEQIVNVGKFVRI
jgi:hypothetical protein